MKAVFNFLGFCVIGAICAFITNCASPTAFCCGFLGALASDYLDFKYKNEKKK